MIDHSVPTTKTIDADLEWALNEAARLEGELADARHGRDVAIAERDKARANADDLRRKLSSANGKLQMARDRAAERAAERTRKAAPPPPSPPKDDDRASDLEFEEYERTNKGRWIVVPDYRCVPLWPCATFDQRLNPKLSAVLGKETRGLAAEFHILAQGGCTSGDFEAAAQAWENTAPESRYGSPWGFIRSVVLTRRGQKDAALRGWSA